MNEAVEDKLDLIGEILNDILAELREIRLAQISAVSVPSIGDMVQIHNGLKEIAKLLENQRR